MQTTTVEFYVYLHRRATDGRVFCVGKGHGKRAWRTEGRNPKWQRQPLTDEEICAALDIDGSDYWTFTVAYAIIDAYERKNGVQP